MLGAHVEYVGFKTEGATRLYALRVRHATGDFQDFTLAIALDAFTSHRARYQDAPDICFLKLQREIEASPDGLAGAALLVTDADLEDYRSAHAPKPPQRRAHPPVVA